MTAYPTWTPAARPGIIPLHPLGFGTILGRAFVALRRNPKVLLGFALVVQSVMTLASAAVLSFVVLHQFLRLDTLAEGTDAWDEVFAGAIAISILTGLGLSLVTGVLSVVVQAIVIADVAAAVVGDTLGLRALWRRVRPVLGRLIAYALLVTLTLAVAGGAGVAAVAGVWVVAGAWAIAAGVVAALGGLVLFLWLTVKLLLVPAVLVVERPGLWRAVTRSWQLTRGRYWPTLGIILVINLSFAAVAQVVNVPITIATTVLSVVVMPTGATEGEAMLLASGVSLIGQAVVVLIQMVAAIVQATAIGIIYVDCRMRREGLDLDLLAHREQRLRGAEDLPDPYLLHIGRTAAPRPAVPTWGPAGGYGPPPSPPQPGPPGSGPAAPASGTAPAPDGPVWAPPGQDGPR